MITTQNFNDHVRIEAKRDIGVATMILERSARRNPVDRPIADETRRNELPRLGARRSVPFSKKQQPT